MLSISDARRTSSDVATGLPATVWTEFVVRDGEPADAQFMIRLQNVQATGTPVNVSSLEAAVGLPGMRSCVERTLSLQQTRQSRPVHRLVAPHDEIMKTALILSIC